MNCVHFSHALQSESARQIMSDPQSETTPMELFSSRMAKILKNVTCPIATGGFVELESEPTIRLLQNEKENEEIEFKISPATEQPKDGYGDEARNKKLQRQVDSLEQLKSRMPQACFGKGQETLVDPSVRSAFQLGAKDFAFDTITTEQMEDILQTIKTDLRLETDLVAEPYSLNMYEKGGKFVKHKDTPRGDDMVGTLLFCLPSLFTGGTFEVTMGMEKKSYFTSWGEEQGGYYAWWNPEYYGEEKVKTVPWAAFF